MSRTAVREWNRLCDSVEYLYGHGLISAEVRRYAWFELACLAREIVG